MPRTCTVCTSSNRAAIEESLVLGESYRSIANRCGTSHTALVRHKQNCVGELLARAETAHEIESAEQILEKLSGLQVHLSRLLKKAEQEKSYGAAVSACRETARVLALLGSLRAAFEESRMAAGEAQPWRFTLEYVDSVMDKAGTIREGKVRCGHCGGAGYVEAGRVLTLPPATENGVHSLGSQPNGKE